MVTTSGSLDIHHLVSLIAYPMPSERVAVVVKIGIFLSKNTSMLQFLLISAHGRIKCDWVLAE